MFWIKCHHELFRVTCRACTARGHFVDLQMHVNITMSTCRVTYCVQGNDDGAVLLQVVDEVKVEEISGQVAVAYDHRAHDNSAAIALE